MKWTSIDQMNWAPIIDQMKSDLYRYEMKWLQEFLQAK